MLTAPRRGFTLVELSVTLAVFGLLMAFGLPALTDLVANHRVRSVAESLEQDIRFAQAEAVRRNRIVALVLTNSATDGTTLTPASPARQWGIRALPMVSGSEGSASSSGTTTRLRTFAQDSSSDTTIRATRTLLCFNSLGRVTATATAIADAGGTACSTPSTADATTLRVQNDRSDRPLWVQIFLGGQIRLCDPNRLLPDQPNGCCTTACCGLSEGSYCKF